MHGGGFACGGSMSGHQSLLSRSLLHLDKRFKAQYKYIRTVSSLGKLGSVTGPIIQDNGRMTCEDDMRSGVLLHYKVNQCLHWACRLHGCSWGSWGWLDVERCELCLQGTLSIITGRLQA